MTFTEARRAAHEKGERFFFTNKPCKRGHVAKRYVCSGLCVECTPSFRAKKIPDAYLTTQRFNTSFNVPVEMTPAELVELEAYLLYCAHSFSKTLGKEIKFSNLQLIMDTMKSKTQRFVELPKWLNRL